MKKLHRQRLEGLSSGIEALDTATVTAVSVSESCLGIEHTGRQNRALFILAKMISHNMSILNLVQKAIDAPRNSSLLDHFSVAALGRVSIDAAIMGLYISEPSLNKNQWNLRRHVLFYHDAINRKRFLSSMGKAANADMEQSLSDYPEAKATLSKAIDRYGLAEGLSTKQVDELKDGRVFISGVRGAVREAGLNVDAFDGHNSYLSQFVHGYPVSFIRAADHAIAFDEPSAYQKHLCNYVMESVSGYTEAFANRMQNFCGHIAKDPLGPVE